MSMGNLFSSMNCVAISNYYNTIIFSIFSKNGKNTVSVFPEKNEKNNLRIINTNEIVL